jgi:exopolysaccharide biosynthesis polyprenyl glycosylphosphotransferase
MSTSAERVESVDERFIDLDDRTREILALRQSRRMARRRGWLVRRMLVGADLFGLILSFAIAQLVFGPSGLASGTVNQAVEWGVFLGSLPLWLMAAKLYGLYERDEERTDHSTIDDFVDVFHMITVGAWLFFVANWTFGLARPDVWKLSFFWALAVTLVTTGRALARTLCRRSVAFQQNAVIVGAGDVGQLIGRKLLQHPEYGVNLVGFVDSAPKERRGDLVHLTLLGPPERLPEIIRQFDVERVVIAFSHESHEELLRLIRSLKDRNVQIDIVPRLFDIVGPGVEIHTVEGLPLLGLRPLRLARSSKLVKRTMDLVFSSVGLIVLLPLFVGVAVAIKLESSGPVFFRQVRMGREDRTFRMFKFRTMHADADERKDDFAHLNKHAAADPRMFKIKDDPRVTKVGRFLRAYSLDELPQLLNVVRGDMSLVGPRPLILNEDQHVTEWARSRLDLRPGLTGLWQVLGRSEIPFEEMTKLDYLYVTNWTLRGDIALIMRTIPAVLRARSAY